MNLYPDNRPYIVSATLDDLAQIAALARLVWYQHYPGIISIEQIEYMLKRQYHPHILHREIASDRIHYDRLLVGSELIGFAAYGPTPVASEMKLHKLYVHPAWQRQGYGSMLLEHVARQAEQQQYQRLILSVNKRNQGAITVYLRSGFVIETAVIVDIGQGFVMDDYVMVKVLEAKDPVAEEGPNNRYPTTSPSRGH